MTIDIATAMSSGLLVAFIAAVGGIVLFGCLVALAVYLGGRL